MRCPIYGIRMNGLQSNQIVSAVKGDTLNDLSEVDAVVFETALKLARARGPLDKESWHVADGKLGKEGAARVAHVVAWFVYSCTLLNIGAVNVSSDHVSDVA